MEAECSCIQAPTDSRTAARGGGDCAVGHGADVEKVVAAFGDDFDKPADDVAGGLPFVIELE